MRWLHLPKHLFRSIEFIDFVDTVVAVVIAAFVYRDNETLLPPIEGMTAIRTVVCGL
jgi:hypothetical protein